MTILTRTTPTVFSCMIALTLLTGCSGRPAATATAQKPVAAAVAQPAAVATVGAVDGPSVTGTVLETMDASNYTYVRVKTDSRELWAAASQFKVAVGDTVVLSLDQPMENFHSQALNRDFPVIYFVARIGAQAGASPPALAVGHAAGQGPATSASSDTVTAAIEPARQWTAIAAVWKTRASLAGKQVTVHAKVVKYNGGILGVNWIHLKDGTGSAADGSNDITVTSEMETKVGDTVTATGTVALNKDLGSGYNYPVIIEHATIAHR